MTRILTVLVFVLCVCAVMASALEQPQVSDSSEHSTLQGLRHTAAEYWKQGQFQKAANCYSDILRLSEASLASEFAEDLHSMAVIHGDLGRFPEAKTYYRRELEVLQHSGNQVAAGVTYTSIAAILQIEGAFSEAEASYQNALDLLNRYAGPTDVRTATALNGMGWLYTLWGRAREAGQLVEKASETAEELCHPMIPTSSAFSTSGHPS